METRQKDRIKSFFKRGDSIVLNEGNVYIFDQFSRPIQKVRMDEDTLDLLDRKFDLGIMDKLYGKRKQKSG